VASMNFRYTPDGGKTYTGFSEMLGMPLDELDTTYYFPVFDTKRYRTQLRFANLGTNPTNVTVKIGKVEKDIFNLDIGQDKRVTYDNLDDGPVVISSDGELIVASMRVLYNNGPGTPVENFAEMLGMPANRLTTAYMFPFYNNKDFASILRIANVGTSSTNVTISINGEPMGTYPLEKDTFKRVSYNIKNGPVVIESDGQPIVASMNFHYSPDGGKTYTGFSEMLGLLLDDLDTAFYFPVFDTVRYNTQLRFANLGNNSTNVTVKIGEVEKDTFPLLAGQDKRLTYDNLDDGPVVVSSDGELIVASIRVLYNEGPGTPVENFAEMPGMPAKRLTTAYMFPFYNNKDFNSQLRFGMP